MSALDDFKRSHSFAICVDSDGCAMDTMNIKHIRCFGPCMVEEWGLEAWRDAILKRWNEINLYSGTRGINRFKGLAVALAEIHAQYTPIDGIELLSAWAKDAPELSNDAVAKKIPDHAIFEKALRWSRAVNRSIEAMLERLNSGESLQFAYEKLHIIYPDITKIKTGLADILFDSEMELNLGGVTAHLIHVDTPHTRDAVLIYVPEDKVLIGGDAHDVDYYDKRGKFDADRLKQFVDFLRPLPFEHYLKGHDGASVEKGELLSALENGKTLPGSLMM